MKFLNYIDNDILNEGIEDKGIFKAVFMTGNPGAGKSYVLSKIKDGQIEPRIVNTDKFTEFLNIHDIYSVYDKAVQLTMNQLVLYINGALPLFVDMTGCNIGRIKNRVDALERMGYDTICIFVSTSLETSLERASKRVRVVPPAVVKDYYEKMNKIKLEMKALFPFTMEIKNDDGELTDDVVLKAFKRVSYFYNSPIENPIGKNTVQLMRQNNQKYLDPNIIKISEIKSIVSPWFKK